MLRLPVAAAASLATILLPAVLTLRAGAHQSKAAVTPANSHPVYRELRSLAVGTEAYKVANLVLSRDAAAFTLTGTMYMLPAVQGKITGAVFIGDGTMAYAPPLAAERSMLANLTRGEAFTEAFERAVFRFTDDTADQIKKAGAAAAGSSSQATDLLKDTNQALRFRLRDNLHARLLQDVLSPKPGGLFHAFIAGKKYSDKLVYTIDPYGAGPVSPEEVQLLSWANGKEGIFAAHHVSDFYRQRQRVPAAAGSWIDIEHQKLATEIEGSGEINGHATTTFASMIDGLAAVPLTLFPTLRVSSVTDADGKPLEYVQESKEEDPDFWVVLPKLLKKGEKLTIQTTYSGKDAISDEGNGNYFPIARHNWYPNNVGIKDYATYDLTFTVPNRVRLVSTGDFVDEKTEGGRYISRWKSDYPMSVAGFNLGTFKREEVKAGDYTIVALANVNPSNSTTNLLRLADQYKLPMGSLDTAASNKVALSEAQNALAIYHEYFGPVPVKRVHMTQQTACNYGQAWPGVIYIPTCYYWGITVRHQLGMDSTRGAYWETVAPHEVAHLWWGHTVGWNSYRDQWMSEGFSNLSASLYLQAAYAKEPQRFRDFWKDMLLRITERNAQGHRPIEVGPVTQGYRLSSGRTGNVGPDIIYPKGAYVLHMLRMMMWVPKEGDAKFKTMLRDFISTHHNQPVTTEDFKAIVEKHMLPEMNLTGDGSMSWFFNQYVYGTALPTYSLAHTVSAEGGQTVVTMKITQSGVSDGFRMLVPIYIELQDGRFVRFGSATMHGNSSVDQKVAIGQLAVKRLVLNYNYDVLAIQDK
jgi:Peptidase family M1 domain